MTETRAAYGRPSDYNKRTDHNQAEIVAALRELGASVTLLHRVGQGCPDIIIGWHGVNILAEIKRPGEKLNERERAWFEGWHGQAAIIYSVLDAVELLENNNPML
jgi:lambda repressor-like predicted transcriptional regulator